MTTLVIGLSLRCSRHRRTETSEYDNIESTSASCRTAIDFTAIDFADLGSTQLAIGLRKSVLTWTPPVSNVPLALARILDTERCT